MKQEIIIVCRCKNGHESFMYPEKCIDRSGFASNPTAVVIRWDCPNCPRNDYSHEAVI